jgi:succinylglutamate desuccinylase
LICTGGLHGNEGAGILALERVVESLQRRQARVSGEFLAFAGNLGALAQGSRYVYRDLNRSWTPDSIEAVRRAVTRRQEDEEQLELLDVVDEAMGRSRGAVFLLDLHTTSGPGEPFSTIMDNLPDRRFALSFPVPLIVGLGELVEGTLLGYLADRGVAAMVFEGGQHSDPEAVATSEAAAWIGLAGAGLIHESGFPEVALGRKRLMAATRGLPPVFEMRYRHPVSPGQGFRMLQGFRSFQPVEAGQVLARDREGDVRSPETGVLLMPLYQAQGEDGFFLIREFHPFWLTMSEILRRLRLGRLLHRLPGVQRDPEDPQRLLVDRRVARWYTLEVLHLLGYRKKLEEADRLVALRQDG